MKRSFLGISVLLFISVCLSGCSAIGDKAMSISVVYCVMAILSLVLLVGYCILIHIKDIWFYLILSSVFVVNTGYFILSISKTLELALWANRISYLGSVFLPLAMLMIIMNVCRIKCRRSVIGLLFFVSILVFLIAASPGYSNIYYKAVTLDILNGVSVLNKEYGPFHVIYLIYLVAYFVSMVVVILKAWITQKLQSVSHATILAVAVFVNLGVWLLEQLVKIDFEMLSVSYIVSVLFLISIYVMMQETKQQKISLGKKDNGAITSTATDQNPKNNMNDEAFAEKCRYFESQLILLTPTERNVYELYLDGKSTKEVLSALNIKENTLKYHNKNIYGKLGVSSRKQLLEIASVLKNK